MKKIILISLFGLMFSVEQVTDNYYNGMPKVIKAYNTNYGKLNLIKETGYYYDGSQKYQKTYYKGELQSFYEWDKSCSVSSFKNNFSVHC